MIKIKLLAGLFLIGLSGFAQNVHVGIFGGLAAYQGDLTDKIFPKKVRNGAIGVTVNYELTPQIMLRGGFTYSVVGGADRYSNDDPLRARNLAFETHITEFSAIGEYYFFNLDETEVFALRFWRLGCFSFQPLCIQRDDREDLFKTIEYRR